MKATATNGIEINTGDPVLIRDTDNEDWRYVYFSHISNNTTFPYASSYGNTKYCIPYKGNEHLVGTNNVYKSYEEKQEQWIKENNIKIGDRVKIIKKSFNGDNGWNNNWIDEMDSYISKISIISGINDNNIFIIFDDNRGFSFPYHLLQQQSCM